VVLLRDFVAWWLDGMCGPAPPAYKTWHWPACNEAEALRVAVDLV
jgi:hypothetical protein